MVPLDPCRLFFQPARAELAGPHAPNLLRGDEPGLFQDADVLLHAGEGHAEPAGKFRYGRVGACRLEEEAAWIERYRQLWAARFDELDKVVEELKRKEKADGRRKRR